MQEYILALVEWALTTEWAAYVMVALAVVGLLVNVLAVLPVSMTERIPNWVMFILNTLAIAAKRGNASKTDMKGNKLVNYGSATSTKPDSSTRNRDS